MKFLSQAEKSLQMESFLVLKQGGMTVKEYVNKFKQLARFGLELVDTPHKKALWFARGWNEPLQGLVMSHIPMGVTFERLVDMALMHEEDKVERKKLRLRKNKTRKYGLSKNNDNKRRAEKRQSSIKEEMSSLWTRGSCDQGLQEKKECLFSLWRGCKSC